MAWYLSSLKFGASGCLHIAAADLIISSDVCFCRVTSTPCPTYEQIYSDGLGGKSPFLSQHDSAGLWGCLPVNTFTSKLALSPQNFDLVMFPFSFLSSLLSLLRLLVYIGQAPAS